MIRINLVYEQHKPIKDIKKNRDQDFENNDYGLKSLSVFVIIDIMHFHIKSKA